VARVGILGGTFNPPHLGHLAIARAALEELALERVVLMPVHTPPHKREQHDEVPAHPEHRLAMCRLLVQATEHVEVCALEAGRPGPSFTVDTLRDIHASHPDAELTFLIGADSASTLPSWREPAALLELAGLAVAARSGSDRERVLRTIASISHGRASVEFLDMPEIDVSASMVRAKVAAGNTVEELVGGAVSDYITEHHLYRIGATA
jgi:nicotinate-nucleotide adenylyltransferase